eukprot:TRINITY_DN11489_c0_g2_i1.p2 TRINITY_DN11489_c0_g2~~TRINITY_DN11489_c0_g2_i1.p2  ORF type:complete len:103 (+),score=20.09 TRINITY_DN11489_c0_g2_i1:55-363(+)
MSIYRIGKAISGIAGGFCLGSTYAYSVSNSLPARPKDPIACEKLLYFIADEPAPCAVGIGVVAAMGGVWPLVGLAAGSFGATTEDYELVKMLREIRRGYREQ